MAFDPWSFDPWLQPIVGPGWHQIRLHQGFGQQALSPPTLGAVLQTLFVQFQPTTLWSLLMMLALIGSGGGLMFRALLGYDDGQE